MTTPFRTLTQTEAVAGHLAGCFGALYANLGTAAPRWSDDAHVVLTYELARSFGATRLSFLDLRAHRAGVSPTDGLVDVPVITDVLASAAARDETGTFTLHVLATLIAPRLLVSLRDAAESASPAGEGPLARTARAAASDLVSATHRIGAGSRAPAALDTDEWRAAAVALVTTLSQAGYGESFGLGVAG